MMSTSIKFGVICERYNIGMPTPCGYIRLIMPLLDIARGGQVQFDFLTIGELENTKLDGVIWQRLALASEDELDCLAAYTKKTGCRLIYDLDDDLLGMSSDHSDFGAYQKKREAVRRSVAMADQVWVSTRELRERYTPIGRDVVWVPNRLDRELWSGGMPDRVEDGRIRFLYAGTMTHRGDFNALILPAFSRLKRRYGDLVSLDVVGVFYHRPDDAPWHLLDPPDHTYIYPVFARWFQSLAGYDCGLAPLLDTAFNGAKSNIKWLEYSSMGWATLASDLLPYREETRNGHDIMLVPPTPDYFEAAMEAMVSEPHRLAKLKASAAARSMDLRGQGDVQAMREAAMVDLVSRSRHQSESRSGGVT